MVLDPRGPMWAHESMSVGWANRIRRPRQAHSRPQSAGGRYAIFLRRPSSNGRRFTQPPATSTRPGSRWHHSVSSGSPVGRTTTCSRLPLSRSGSTSAWPSSSRPIGRATTSQSWRRSSRATSSNEDRSRIPPVVQGGLRSREGASGADSLRRRRAVARELEARRQPKGPEVRPLRATELASRSGPRRTPPTGSGRQLR